MSEHERAARDEAGFALVTVLLLLALLMSLGFAYFTLTQIEVFSTRANARSLTGLYAAEAGVEWRGSTLRALLESGATPSGAAPSPSDPCKAGNDGSGDLACDSLTVDSATVATWATPRPGDPVRARVSRGDPFQELSANESVWSIDAESVAASGVANGALRLHLRLESLPAFQFAALFDKDLEIDTPATFGAPVFAGGDLYVAPASGVATFEETIIATGSILRGPKEADTCPAGAAVLDNLTTSAPLPTCSGSRRDYTDADLAGWRGMARRAVTAPQVPGHAALLDIPSGSYWTRADLRLVLDINATPAIVIRAADGTTDAAASATLAGCGALQDTYTFRDNREAGNRSFLEVDVPLLLDCIQANSLLGAGVGLDEVTDGGLVLFFSVDGPASAGVNLYGVRLKNVSALEPTGLAPSPVAVTLVTDQALFVEGHFNTTSTKPAALVGDTVHLLSAGWTGVGEGSTTLAGRVAGSTQVIAAVLAGTDTTGGFEGAAGRDSGGFGGGLLGLIRLHEDWSAATLTYRGSFVSPFGPQHAAGAWNDASPQFQPPTWDWAFDTALADVDAQPPATPAIRRVRRELEVRRFLD